VHRRALLTLLLLAAPLAGCAPAPAGVPVAAAAVAQPLVRVSGRLALGATGRRLLVDTPAVTLWQASDVTAFKVFLKREGGTELELGELAGGATTIELADLQPSTPYLLRLEAYADAERIDAGGDACETAFTTDTSPELTGKVFQVKLKDTELPVGTEGNLEITNGTYLAGS